MPLGAKSQILSPRRRMRIASFWSLPTIVNSVKTSIPIPISGKAQDDLRLSLQDHTTSGFLFHQGGDEWIAGWSSVWQMGRGLFGLLVLLWSAALFNVGLNIQNTLFPGDKGREFHTGWMFIFKIESSSRFDSVSNFRMVRVLFKENLLSRRLSNKHDLTHKQWLICCGQCAVVPCFGIAVCKKYTTSFCSHCVELYFTVE